MEQQVSPVSDEGWRHLVDLDALLGWMDSESLEDGPLEDIQRLTGGTQNILLRFRRGERHFVLRRPPPHPRQDGSKTIAREARVLAALADTNVPHARLIAACDDKAVIGASFYLMEPIDGFNAAREMPPLHTGSAGVRRQMGMSMVDALLKLGEVDHVAVGLEDFGRADGFLERQVPRWTTQFESYSGYAGWPGPSSLPGVADVAGWLSANCPDTYTPGIMHGDYHLSNVMFSVDNPNVAAIVDWELTTIGDPLLDLAWLVTTWPDDDGQGVGTIKVQPWDGFPTEAELIAYYRERSVRDTSRLDWYLVLARFKLGILLEGNFARACAGKASMTNGRIHHASAVRLLKQACDRIG